MFVAKPRNLRRLWLLYSSKPPKCTITAEKIFEQIGQTHYQSQIDKAESIPIVKSTIFTGISKSSFSKQFILTNKPKTDFNNLPPIEYTDRSKSFP